MSRQRGRHGARGTLRLIVLALACIALAVAFYGPLAWMAGLVVLAPVAVLIGVRRRRLTRRGLRRAARAVTRAV